MRFHNLPDEVYNDLLDKASKYEDLKDANRNAFRYTTVSLLDVLDLIDKHLRDFNA